MDIDIDKGGAKSFFYRPMHHYLSPRLHCFYLQQDIHWLPLRSPVRVHKRHRTWHQKVYRNHNIHNGS
jgi:hypothetical protein